MLNPQHKNKIEDLISQKEPTAILSHLNPDGDSVGASLGLALFLIKNEVPVSIIIPNEIPEFLRWLPGFEMIRVFSKNRKQCYSDLKEASVIFFVDFNDPTRLGDGLDSAVNSSAYKILLDHHQNPSDFSDINISEPWRGSAGEMVYILIEELKLSQYIDEQIATCLYVAIMTDTGNFRYGSSYAEVFRIAGSLVDKGINKDEIYSNVYDSYSLSRMKLMGYCMSEKMKFLDSHHTAYMGISMDELNRFNYQTGDTEGFVNVPFSVKGVRISVLFIEKKDHIKVSLRSKGNFSVDQFARKYYNGGGHVNAAGGESSLSLEETLKQFEQIIAKHASEIIDH